MNYKLTATLTLKHWGKAVIKEMFYSGDTIDSVLAQIQQESSCPDHFLINLKKHKRTAFKDVNGVKHSWKLVEL